MTWRRMLAVLLALPLLGMGALGGGSTGAPERDFHGSFVDRDGIKVEARWITAGGELALSGDLGRGSLRISFDEIRAIEFSGDDKGLTAHVALKKGDPIELRVRSALAFSGQTSVGQYRIRARDLKSVELAAE